MIKNMVNTVLFMMPLWMFLNSVVKYRIQKMKYHKSTHEKINHFLKKPLHLRKKHQQQKLHSFSKLIRETSNVHVWLRIEQEYLTFSIPKSSTFRLLYSYLLDKTPKKYKEKIIGFETQNSDFAIDYQLQNQIGEVEKCIKLKLFLKQKKQGLSKYKVCKCLSIGGFSKVFLIRSLIDGEFYAGKFIEKNTQKNKKCEYLFKNQKLIHQKVSNDFLVRLCEFIETEKFYIFVMEYCPGGELFYLLKRANTLTESQAKFYVVQILLGLEYLHKNQIVYRDLKPENILIDAKGHAKIADFGLAKQQKERSFSYCGSLQYMAPEIIKGSGHTEIVDYYCLGALLYEMLIGFPPFYDPNQEEEVAKQKILREIAEFPSFIPISDQVKDLILRLISKVQNQRLGFYGGAKQIFLHPWFSDVKIKDYQKKLIQSPFEPDLRSFNISEEQLGESERIFQMKIEDEMQILRENNERNRRKIYQSIGKRKKTSFLKTHSPYSSSLSNPRSTYHGIKKTQLSLEKKSLNKNSIYRFATQGNEEERSKSKLVNRFRKGQKENLKLNFKPKKEEEKIRQFQRFLKNKKFKIKERV